MRPVTPIGIVFEATELTGDLRTAFDDGTTTSGAAWFSLDEVQALDRVELVDFVLRADLIEVGAGRRRASSVSWASLHRRFQPEPP